MSDSDHGTPFDDNSTDPIDDWSRAVFEACRDWPLASSGRWYRVEEGWLRLRIEEVDGEKLEPLFAIDVDMPDDQIMLDFGSWASPITPRGNSLREAAGPAVAKAREVVEDWLSGALKIAVYSDEAGWRGSKLIEGGELPAAIEPVPVEIGEQGRVLVKTPRRAGWRAWCHMGDGLWLECEATEN